jgi:hypothetical protein
MAKTAKKQNEVSFDCSDEDQDFIHRIVTRAKELGLIGRNYSGMTCTMDITATHANGNPLRLRDLLNADDFNFMHDVCGIARHLDRDTGQLGGFFSPRFSKH